MSRGIPWIYGAAVGSYGLAMPVIPGRTACLRCVYPEPPAGIQPTCETAGVLNAIDLRGGVRSGGRRVEDPLWRVAQVQPRITTIDSGRAASARSRRPRAIPIVPPVARREFSYLSRSGGGRR